MLCLVRAARRQLCQAFEIRGQWLKCAPPCAAAAAAAPAQIYSNRWKGGKRLVAFPFQCEKQPTFCHRSKRDPPFFPPVCMIDCCASVLLIDCAVDLFCTPEWNKVYNVVHLCVTVMFFLNPTNLHEC